MIIRNSLILIFFVFGCSAVAEQLPATPIIKNGSCPSGYVTSGKYCMPSSHAKMAIEKIASCPSGYVTSGRYCVASSANTRHAIPKVGSCPNGYATSGGYCLNTRSPKR